MSSQEKMIEKLKYDLNVKVEQYFDSIDRFEHEFVLNSKITKDSPFEKNPFCSEFTLYNLDKLPITDVIIGDLKEINVTGNIRIATSSLLPKKGKELNSWSSSIFGISINAKVSFSQETRAIEVSKVEVRSR